MVSIYTHRDSNIRKTWVLFSLFLIFVIGFGWVFSRIYARPEILYFAVIFSVLMNIFAYWYSDKIVLKMTGAQPVSRENYRELYNIVENLTITAGLPLPKIYIVRENQLNAFATGRNPEHAVVAVTEGLLKRLDRSELEGVIAHELSHIGNRDMLISTAVVVLVGFISILSDIFMRSMFWGGMGRNREGRGAGGIFLLIGIVLAIIAPIAAMLIQLAISRKREFLADASGVLLTRYPDGLVKAFEKISSDATPMNVANNTTAHLWLDDPFKGKNKTSWFHKLFITHPPIEERIQALRGIKM
ncbi:MAG: M48 family metallopeptidase [Candidatus Paceibacteria bacterium]